jgi:hypothetical protein
MSKQHRQVRLTVQGQWVGNDQGNRSPRAPQVAIVGTRRHDALLLSWLDQHPFERLQFQSKGVINGEERKESQAKRKRETTLTSPLNFPAGLINFSLWTLAVREISFVARTASPRTLVLLSEKRW